MNRDVVASLNIAYKGWARFIHPRVDAIEATGDLFSRMMEPKSLCYDDVVIQIVDVSKSGRSQTKPTENLNIVKS